MTCTRCDGTGFLNLHQVGANTMQNYIDTGNPEVILKWIASNVNDVSVCDCCGDGETWYGEPGQHDWNNPNAPKGCR